jgi:hypothetical protein
MGRARTATALLVVTAALVASSCGGSASSTVPGSTTTSAKVGPNQKHSHSFQINGDDPAFRMFCRAKSPAARIEGLQALTLEIRSSPHAPAHVNVHEFAHELKGLCGQGASAPR